MIALGRSRDHLESILVFLGILLGPFWGFPRHFLTGPDGTVHINPPENQKSEIRKLKKCPGNHNVRNSETWISEFLKWNFWSGISETHADPTRTPRAIISETAENICFYNVSSTFLIFREPHADPTRTPRGPQADPPLQKFRNSFSEIRISEFLTFWSWDFWISDFWFSGRLYRDGSYR